jgi:Asp-tRNA(Asn)/Glu-tRNA(Gln) amidotransferase A subunit family amidase
MAWDRRTLFTQLAAMGVGSATFQRALAAQAPEKGKLPAITPEMVQQAEWIAGVPLTEQDRKTIAPMLTQYVRDWDLVRKKNIAHEVPPAFHHAPLGRTPAAEVTPAKSATFTPAKKPATDAELAYLPVAALGQLLRSKAISSVELTKVYLERLKTLNPKLLFAVTITEELALKQAKTADEELAAGRDRGPLHGIPWGAKDLISVPGAKTTWGAAHFKDQVTDTTATVVKKLDQAGAVLVAKLTLGALAMGDQWFGGMTRNPWNPDQGSSGSSAGSASAVVAGAVGFAIGSETLGSIVSPCTRCGATGLRPSFGRVSRAGCMTLSWTMDKLGPIARTVNDCALVFAAIHGADPQDPGTVTKAFSWPVTRALTEIRVGVFETTPEEHLKVLKDMGVKTVPVKLPEGYPLRSMMMTLDAECAAAFDFLTAQGVREGLGLWAGTFRKGQFVSAVAYLQTQRLRTLLMRDMDELFKTVDCYIGGSDLHITNLTGHPCVVMPAGFRTNGTPTAVTLTGAMDQDHTLLAVAHEFQTRTGHHLKHPKL